MGVAAEVGEGDDLPLRPGQHAQRPGQPLAVEGLRRRLVSLVPQLGGRGGLLVADGGGSGAADPVDRPPPGDHHRPPGGAALARVVVHGSRPQLEEHLLGDLLGLGRVAQHGRDLPVDRLAELLVNQVKCPMLSAAYGSEQRIQVPVGRGRGARPPALVRAHERYSKAAGLQLAFSLALSTTMTSHRPRPAPPHRRLAPGTPAPPPSRPRARHPRTPQPPRTPAPRNRLHPAPRHPRTPQPPPPRDQFHRAHRAIT
jgi:hypothetical protein